MAKALGGWFPTSSTDFSRDMACMAASGGEGDNGQGWPEFDPAWDGARVAAQRAAAQGRAERMRDAAR